MKSVPSDAEARATDRGSGADTNRLYRAETPARRRRLSTPPPPPPVNPDHAHMPGPLELWLLSPKVPAFDHESPWFEREEEDEPLPLLHQIAASSQPPSQPPSTQRSETGAASSLSPAALSVPPSSAAAPGRRAPSRLVVVGYLAIAAAAVVWLAHDDDPSRYVPGLTRESILQPASSDLDPTATVAAELVGADQERARQPPAPSEPGSLRGPFNRVAAANNLTAAVAEAARCTARRPRTEARAWVTFAPSGQVSAVRFDRQLTGPTAHAACVAAALGASSVPPFDGQPVTVTVRVPMWMPLQNEPAPPQLGSDAIYPDDALDPDDAYPSND